MFLLHLASRANNVKKTRRKFNRTGILFITSLRGVLAEQTISADGFLSPNISCICLCVGFVSRLDGPQ